MDDETSLDVFEGDPLWFPKSSKRQNLMGVVCDRHLGNMTVFDFATGWVDSFYVKVPFLLDGL